MHRKKKNNFLNAETIREIKMDKMKYNFIFSLSMRSHMLRDYKT